MDAVLACLFYESFMGIIFYIFITEMPKKCTRFSNNAVYINIDGNCLICRNWAGESVIRELSAVNSIDIFQDTKSLEVFINGGEASFSYWLDS